MGKNIEKVWSPLQLLGVVLYSIATLPSSSPSLVGGRLKDKVQPRYELGHLAH